MSKFETPESWAETTIGDVVEQVQYGANASASASGDLKLLRITDITSSGVDWDTVPFCKLSKGEGQKYKLNDGDIVFARTGATVGKSFRITNAPSNAIFASYLIRLMPKAPLKSERFFELFFHSPSYWDAIKDGARGAAQPNVNSEILKAIRLPLPPLGEQKRIVAKIDATQEKIKTIEQSVTKAEELIGKYRETLLQKAFRGELVPQNPKDEPALKLLERIRAARTKQTDGKKKKKDDLPPIKPEEIPFQIPKSWNWVRLGDILRFQNGYSFKSSEWATTGLPIIRIQNLNRNGGGEFNYFKGKPAPEWTIHSGDLLFAWSGSKGVSFGAHFWSGSTAVLNQHIFKVTPDAGIERKYLYWLLKQFQSRIEDDAHGFKETFVHVRQSDLKKVVVPIPPMAEQMKIAEALLAANSALDRQMEIILSTLVSLSNLRNSILNSAFSGGLVPQDSAEGCGQQLLEQIDSRAETDDQCIKAKPAVAKKKRAKA